MRTWFSQLIRTYRYGPTTALGIAGLIAIIGALFFNNDWLQAVLINIGTALLLIPPIVVTERLALSDEVEAVRQNLEERLAATRDTVASIARLRRKLPSSQERTVKQSQLFNEAKEHAKNTNINAEEAGELIESYIEGVLEDRLVLLAFAEVKQYPEFFPLVIEAIANRKAPFEQSRALDAAKVMLTKLSNKQKQKLVAVINNQRSKGENEGFSRDSYRWSVSERILNELNH